MARRSSPTCRGERPAGQEEFASARGDLLRKLPSQFETNGPGSRLPVRPGHEAVVSTSNHGR